VVGEIVYPCTLDFPDGRFPELCRVVDLGSEEASVVALSLDHALKSDPAWSPDGTTLAWVQSGGIYVRDLWSTFIKNPVRIATGSEPSWSANGRFLAYTTAGGDVDVVDEAGKRPRRLIGNAAEPSWSSLGQVAFVRGASIWRVSATGKSPRSLGPGTDPSWAPSGKLIAFSYRGDIWTMNANGGSRRQLTQTADVDETKPSWAAGGKEVAFEGAPSGGGPVVLYVDKLGHGISAIQVGSSEYDSPFAATGVSWQHVRMIVPTISDKRPYVTVRDGYGHRFSTIPAGAYDYAYVDHSRRRGFAWSLGLSGHVGGPTIKYTGTDWPGVARDEAYGYLGVLKPRKVTFWDFAHKNVRGSFRVVDRP